MSEQFRTPIEEPKLETGRLVLRLWRLEDASDVAHLAGSREVSSTIMSFPHPYTREMADAWVARQIRESLEGQGVRFAITLRDGGELCGGIGLNLNLLHKHAELGYWLGMPFWGRGYGSEAAAAVVAFGFDVLGLHRIFASHFAGNEASGRILQKIGMQYEGCLRGHLLKDGQFVDLHSYAVLATDPRRSD